MQDVDDTTYHIYLKERCVYYNLSQDDFEEKWQMLNVMIDLITSNYTEKDLSYIKLAPKIGVGGPGKVIPDTIEEHSY
tara:strand:- start:191 stop:424 length:234 start_codon:yes stop_codon:yes gene_type:complete